MIVFVRHGETPPNREGLVLGRADPGLTDEGRRQAARLADALAARPVRAVVTSPLGRARQTAEPVADACRVEPLVDDRLIEFDWGAWEGRPAAAIGSDELTAMRADHSTLPEGEPLSSVRERIESFCGEYLTEGGLVVAVSHVSPIKAAVAWALDVDDTVAWRMFLGLGSITRIGRGQRGPLLVSFNETAHLEVPAP